MTGPFICGTVGEVSGDGLHEGYVICPERGSDVIAVFKRSAPAPSAEPVAWQWRYVGDEKWLTPLGGEKLTKEELARERPIEQRPLYSAPQD